MKTIKEVVAVLFISSSLITHAQTQVAAQAEAPDSMVRIAAEAKGLSLASPETIPLHGTFWLANNEGSFLLPLPCLPDENTNAPIFQLGDGQFLVDGTGGVLPQPSRMQARLGITMSNLLERQGSAVLDLIDQVAEAQVEAEMMELFPEMYSMESEELESSESMSSMITFPDPGLRIVIPTNALSVPTQFSVILTNTIPDEPYDVLTKTDLNAALWNVEVSSVYATTNFIPATLNRNGRTNLFVWARYAGDSTGSGIPDWWLLQYFGTTSVDPYGDDDGDGWNNLQEYQNGTNPTQFNMPPPPKSVTATLDSSGTNVVLTWQSGGVTPTEYGIIKNGTELLRVGGTNLTYSGIGYFVNNYYAPYGSAEPAFQIRAYYSSGAAQSSVVTVAKPSLTINGARIIRGADGQTYLSTGNLPSGLSFLRFYWSTLSSPVWFDLPVTNLIGGMMSIATNNLLSSRFPDQLPLSVKAFSTNGNFGAGTYAPFLADDEIDSSIDPDAPFRFVDARRQMKENLIFLLRSASATRPFRYGPATTYWNPPYDWINASFSDYTYYGFRIFEAYDGIYHYNGHYSVTDELRPVKEHFLWRNFVFNTVDLTNGLFKTGVTEDSYGDDGSPLFVFLPQPKYQFSGNGQEFPLPLAFTNATSTWLKFSDFFLFDMMPDLGLSGDTTSFSFAANFKNFFGLPVNSLHYYKQGAGFVTMTGGQQGGPLGSAGFANVLFAEVEQPQLSTVDYYFVSQTPYFQNYQYSDTSGPAIPMPGSPSFASTNTSPLLITGVGQTLTVSGWAKNAILNGYSDRFAYLEQYFDKAYTLGTNGIATTNSTGILSPYGEFLPTQPGPAALVTMPDIDTGQRGTGVVQVVKLQLDVNHDGVMDLSFGGPDNTSHANPFVFWVNNDFDRWNDIDLNTDKEQDDMRDANCPYTPKKITPDFAYQDASGNQTIPSMRDLEDYTRFWIPGLSNVMAAIPTNFIVTLTLTGDAQLRLFRAYEPSGATNYLFDTTTGSNQVAQSGSLYVGLLDSSSTITLNHSWGEHFIWCGAQRGSGQITLTIFGQGGTNILAQTSAWIDLKDIKEMYERWTVGDIRGTNGPVLTNVAYTCTEGLPAGTVAFKYKPNTDASTPYILFVHGWNMAVWDKELPRRF